MIVFSLVGAVLRNGPHGTFGSGVGASVAKAWPPQTFPRPSGFPALRLDGLPLSRGDLEAEGQSPLPSWICETYLAE